MKQFIEVTEVAYGKEVKIMLNISCISKIEPDGNKAKISFVTDGSIQHITTAETYEEIKALVASAQ